MGPENIKGRGSSINPGSRFTKVHACFDADLYDQLPDDWRDNRPETTYIPDKSRSIISYNNSPDVGFDASINPYRGCEHGCIYCYARPSHEYFGYSLGLDFETKILIKHEAPRLLEAELSKKSWKPQPVAVSGNCDPYQPIERKLKLTRQCLEVFASFKNPVMIITKNQLVARDIDILQQLASYQAVTVSVSVTTLDPDITSTLEPRTSRPENRIRTIELLASAGIPVRVMVAPVILGLTDHEMPAILNAAAQAGATMAGMVVLRLPHGVKDLFTDWLKRYHPERHDKVVNRIKDLRDGKLNNPNFNQRMTGKGVYGKLLNDQFRLNCQRLGLNSEKCNLSCESFENKKAAQLRLFQ